MGKNGKIITDAMGQWKHPGKPTRIPGNDITMMGVNYPVYAKPNKGKGMMMYPGENYNFPKADYVDEYPVNINIPSLGKPQQGLYAFPNLDISDNVPHFGATVGYKTPKINISGNYMYGNPTVTAAFNFESGGQHGGLDRWFAEKWVDVKTGKACGRQEGEKRKGYPACRPSRRVSEDTPKTAGELSSSEREKFKRSKTSSERINYQHRRKEDGGEINEQDMANKPNNPALWSRAKSLARQKFDVYPSAYANGWAAKWYKGKGGTWRKAEYGMEVPYMEDGGKPEWLVEAQLKAQGYSGDALQQKMSSMAQGGEKMPPEIARARFAAAGNLDKMADYGYAYGGYIPEMMYGGYDYMDEGGEANGEMALGQMAAVSDKMAKLLQFVKPEDNLDPWIASKLAVMDHSADAISDYMMYGAEGDEEGEEEEEGSEMNEQEMEEMKMGGIPQRYKNMGFTKVGVKKNSTRPGKKWMVLAKKGDQYKVVHGGYDGMKDFSQHGSEKRKANFWNRMGGKSSSKATDPFSPLYWHKRFGTWEQGGEIYEMQKGGTSSIVDYLAQRGMANDKASRKKLAEQLGIDNYDFSADKNLELLSLMKNQEIKDPVKKSAPSSQRSSYSKEVPSMLAPSKSSLYDSMFPFLSGNPFSVERRNLESGTIVDKGTNTMYIIQDNKVVKKAPVLTGQAGKNKSKDPNKNVKGVTYLENNPQDRSTPTGTYFMQEPGKAGIYGWPGFGLKPIPAFGQSAPEARATAIHITYGSKPKPGSGMKGYPDPAEFKRRNAAYEGPASDRYMSYGCTNAQGETIDCLKNMFPKGDTAIYIDSRNPADKKYINSVKQRNEKGGSTFSGNAFYKMGGAPCYECGGMFAYGGNILMDTTVAPKIDTTKKPNPVQAAWSRTVGFVPADSSKMQQMRPQFNSAKEKLQQRIKEKQEKQYKQGGINLDPAKKGTFKAQATRMGMGVQEAAAAILNAPEGKYSPEMRKKANFARNFAKQMGGLVQGAEVEVTPEQAELLRQQGYDFEII